MSNEEKDIRNPKYWEEATTGLIDQANQLGRLVMMLGVSPYAADVMTKVAKALADIERGAKTAEVQQEERDIVAAWDRCADKAAGVILAEVLQRRAFEVAQ